MIGTYFLTFRSEALGVYYLITETNFPLFQLDTVHTKETQENVSRLLPLT